MILTPYRLGLLFHESLSADSWDSFCALRTGVTNTATVKDAFILNTNDAECLKNPPNKYGKTAYTEAPTYFIDRYNFRHVDESTPTDLSAQDKNFKHIAFVGCSLTYGTAMPYTDIYPYILSKKIEKYLKVPCKFYNLGEPGASMSSIARIFRLISGLRSFDYVFFLLPPVERFEAVKVYFESAPEIPKKIYFGNITASMNFKDLQQTFGDEAAHAIKRKITERSDSDVGYEVIKDIQHLIDVCKINGMKYFIGSWGDYTYDLLAGYLHSQPDCLLPKFESGIDNQWGVDLSHPGKPSHDHFSNSVMDFIRSKNL